MTSDGMTPQGRWAVILGVSTGTGAAVARAVAAAPAMNVFGVHRGNFPDEAGALEAEIRSAGRRVFFHVGDAGTPAGVRTSAAVLRETAGARSVGLLVHSIAGASVGHFLPGRAAGFHQKQVEKTFNYLAHSFVYWAQILRELDLLAPGARLFGLTNSLHDSQLHNTGLIAASKAALEMYVRYLAMEMGPLGHRVNLLKFGTVITPALARVLGPGAMEHLEEVHRRMIPAGRMCTLEEVGRLLALLATSEDAAWFNGATIDFTGGMTLRLLDLVLQPD
jgi:NAD(P)-dependent dehydrogenase (short-subunit alcohol dehydrogenase family)